jgi:ribonuclease-3
MVIEQLRKHLDKIEDSIGYRFKDRSLLSLAFVHRSYVNEHQDIAHHNERLEFLGDSVLGLLISDYLYQVLPGTPEGTLSSLRAKLVNSVACMSYIHKLNVGGYLLLGRGEKMNNGRGRDSLLANLFEAIIGAIYLDGGFAAAGRFLFMNFSTEIDSTVKEPQQNSKVALQDLCQKKFMQAPTYRVLDQHGPDHKKMFLIGVLVDERELGRGSGPSKKEAQQAAAADALANLYQLK